MDYAFMGQEGQDGLTKILVVKDRKMKNIFSHPVRAKGAAGETWIANRICKDIRGLGYNKIIIKCDQEPSIVEIQNEVIRRREAETTPENSPPRGSRRATATLRTRLNKSRAK